MLRMPALRRSIESRHDRLVAAIGYVVNQAPVAAIEVERLQDPKLAPILDVAVRVARGSIEVDNPDIERVCRIEFAEYRTMQALVGFRRRRTPFRRTPDFPA